MKVSGKYTINASREQVWEALNNIDVLARVVPGCERLEQTGEHDFEGTVKIGIQAIKGVYSGKIRLEDIQAPVHYKLVAHGQSANGVVDGHGSVDLEEQGEQTLLTYAGEAQVGGVLASVGQRLIDGAARTLINQSLKALDQQIALRYGPAPETPPAPPAPEPPAPVAAEAPVAPQEPAAAVPEPTALPEPPAAPAAAPRKSVVLHPDEQLKPEAVFTGAVADYVKERPWLLWLAAFVVGFLFGRVGRRK